MAKSKFIIGAGMPKAGSTSLFHFLDKSGLFRRYPTKESNYLKNAKFSLEDYIKIFRDYEANNGKPFLEITPSYIYSDMFFQNLKAFDPNDTFAFLVLRDPVHRTISHYMHDLRLGQCAHLPQDFLEEDNFSNSVYFKPSKFSEYIGAFNSISFGNIYLLQDLEASNGEPLLEDIHRKFYSSTSVSLFKNYFGKLPPNNGTGLVPYVTKVNRAAQVKLDGKKVDVFSGSYILERELVPYGYQFEIIIPKSDGHRDQLDRLVSLSGKPIIFNEHHLDKLKNSVFKKEYEILDGLGFDAKNKNRNEYKREYEYSPVVSRLIWT